MMKYVLTLSVLLSAACTTVDEDDASMNLTGTEQYAVRTADGSYVCEAPKKVLICHVPPGNPDNAHTICVGRAAVKPHQEHHGDLLGACDEEADPGYGEDDDSGPDQGGGEPDEGGETSDPESSTPVE
jgi:hypothetical protein